MWSPSGRHSFHDTICILWYSQGTLT
jgi:hypothetical protein